jgi:TIR domain
MHDVLISYSKKDKQWADAACSVLESRGIRCWIAPRDIIAGTEWGAAIIAGIDECKAMVLIFSADANESPQVRREVERAFSKGLTIIPCRIENVMPSGAMEYALGDTHWFDVFTPPEPSRQ